MQDALVETAPEIAISLRAVVPLLVDNPERDVLVRRAGDESDQAGVILTGGSKGLAALTAILPLDSESGGLDWVDEVRVEDVEAVALDDLGWGVVVVVVSLVVLVPFVAHLHAVEVKRLAGLVLVCPWGSHEAEVLLDSKGFLVVVEATGSLTFVQGAGGARSVRLKSMG